MLVVESWLEPCASCVLKRSETLAYVLKRELRRHQQELQEYAKALRTAPVRHQTVGETSDVKWSIC